VGGQPSFAAARASGGVAPIPADPSVANEPQGSILSCQLTQLRLWSAAIDSGRSVAGISDPQSASDLAPSFIEDDVPDRSRVAIDPRLFEHRTSMVECLDHLVGVDVGQVVVQFGTAPQTRVFRPTIRRSPLGESRL